MPQSAVRSISHPIRLGGTVGHRAKLNHNMSRANQMSTFASYVSTEMPRVDLEPVPRKPIYNTQCWYYRDSKTCPFGNDCYFLHDEKPTSVVFHDGTEERRMRETTNKVEHGPLVDAVIYIVNLSPTVRCRTTVRKVAEEHGKVSTFRVLKSKISSGLCSAFLHMTSQGQAEATIAAINQTVVDGMRLKAKMERVDRPCDPPRATITDLAATTVVEAAVKDEHIGLSSIEVHKDHSICSAPLTAENDVDDVELCAICDVESAAGGEVGSTLELPVLESVDLSPNTVHGLSLWTDSDRLRNMRDGLVEQSREDQFYNDLIAAKVKSMELFKRPPSGFSLEYGTKSERRVSFDIDMPESGGKDCDVACSTELWSEA